MPTALAVRPTTRLQPRKKTIYTTVAPPKSRRVIPPHLVMFSQPKDISSFLSDFYPNMLIYVEAKLPPFPDRHQYVEEIVQDFVQYILAPAPLKNHIPRWTAYDPVNFPNIPFHNWLITQLDFHRRTYQQGIFKSLNMKGVVDSVGDDPAAMKGVVNLEVHRDEGGDPEGDLHASLFVREVEEFLDTVSQTYIHHNNTFEKNAFILYRYKMEGVKQTEQLKRLKINTVTLEDWHAQLRIVIEAFMDEGWNAMMLLTTRPRTTPAHVPSNFGALEG